MIATAAGPSITISISNTYSNTRPAKIDDDAKGISSRYTLGGDARLATCYHEAGHVLAAVAFGLRVEGATIEGDWRGSATIYLRGKPARAVLPTLIAGPLSEARFVIGRATAITGWLPRWEGDRDLIVEHLRRLTGYTIGSPERHAEFQSAMKTAAVNLDLNWAGVRTLASTLENRGHLSGAELGRLLRVKPETGDSESWQWKYSTR